MTDNLQTVIEAAEQLSPNEQIELIEAVSRSLQNKYLPQRVLETVQELFPAKTIPAEIKRTMPVQDLSQLKANFWPEDETADDINTFIEQQRRADLLREQ
jgi:hypothetical protein